MRSDQVRHILRQYKRLKSLEETCGTLHSFGHGYGHRASARQKVEVIESWLGLLTEPQAFVIAKHLFEERPWPIVVEAYEAQWGLRDGRAERTLKRYQSVAVNRIARFVDTSGYEPQITALFCKELRQAQRWPENTPVLFLLK